jgi:ligand-binding sensor domain-containing protein
MKRPAILILLLLGIMLQLSAQEPQFRLLEVARKISEIKTYQTDQDQYGYLWLGTNKGILRFDGLHYTEIEIPDSLKSISVTKLKIFGDSVMAGFQNGNFFVINVKSQLVVDNYDLGDAAITSCIIFKKGIWVGTEGNGLFRIEKKTATRYDTQNGLADNVIHAIEESNGKLVVGTDLGVSLCIVSGSLFTCRNLSQEDGLSDNLTLSLCKYDRDHVLAGMQNGSISKINVNTGTTETNQAFAVVNTWPVTKIMRVNNNIMVFTETEGAFVVNWDVQEQIQHFNLKYTSNKINLNRIYDALSDQEGNLIFSVGSNYLLIADFHLMHIKEHDGQSFANASAVICNDPGNLWFSNSAGIFEHNAEFTDDRILKEIYKLPKGMSNIISLCLGNNDDLWFGTFGSGLGHINLKTKKAKIFTEKDGLLNNNVLSITRNGNDLWMATLGGACMISLDEWAKKSWLKPVFKKYESTEELGSSYIYTVHSDPYGRIWLGTDGKGAVIIDGDKYTILRSLYPELGKNVVSICTDTHGITWLLSSDKGLQYITGNELKNFEIISENEKPEIFTIHASQNGQIIAVTSIGIALINGVYNTCTFVRLDFPISTNFLNIIDSDASGKIWIGTEEAMIRLLDINDNKIHYPIARIDVVKVLLQPVDTNLHEFNFNENHLTFDFSGFWYQQVDNIGYEYKLSGFDLGWVKTKDDQVVFPKLSPGKYTFYVRASAADNYENAPIHSYSFTIKRAYWQEWWFFGGCILFTFLIFGIFLWLRIKQLRRREAIERQRIQGEFDTLRNQVNPHFLFNSFNTLITTISKDKDEAIDYVQRLSDYFRIVLEQRNKDIITVTEELELVMHYLFLQQKRFGENMLFECILSDSTKKSAVPPLTLQLLVENAIKHNVISRSKPLTISITEEDGFILVKNNIQPKLTKEPSTGIGLENIRNRYHILFNKEIEVVSGEIDFVIKLPIVVTS